MNGIGPEPCTPLTGADLLRAGGLLFDFDGVIADSERLYMASWNEALAPWGVSIPEEEYFRHWTSLGEGLPGHISRHGGQGIDEARATSLQKRAYEAFCLSGAIGLMPGAAYVLEILSSSVFAGRFAIASNTDSRLVEGILMRAGAPVPPVIGGESLPRKPCPDIFLAAAHAIGSPPGSTLVFEDAWKGLEAARRGGFRPVLVRAPHNAGEALDADFSLDGISGLLPLLGP
ncbi:MAG: HAD family phosphatase [Candidatus Fermentibacter sp.]|nr:HAD family phosphatase [Candidatus Fermentibacter sp.]